MPRKQATQVCSKPGCPELKPCPVKGHEPEPWTGGDQETRARRGKELGSSSWKRKRAQVLKLWPICYVCGIRPSTEVDHITPDTEGGKSELDNLAGICRACHRVKSSREGQRASRR